VNIYKFEELSVGLKKSFEIKITETMMSDFCKLSSDINPLHTSEDYAKQAGFQSRVVYGQLVASFYSTLVGVHLPGKYAILQGIDTKFNKPVFVGDTLCIEGEISFKHDNFKLIEIKAKIRNQEKKKVSGAKITVGLLG